MGEFRITGEGKYRTRKGEVVEITRLDESEYDLGDFYGYGLLDGEEKDWFPNGHYKNRGEIHACDLVARIDEPQTEVAGLTGWVNAQPNGDFSICKNEAQARRIANNGGKVYDLSQLPASAILQPVPKRETRKAWINVYTSGMSRPYISKHDADLLQDENRIACIEREIDFVHGEGLEDAS